MDPTLEQALRKFVAPEFIFGIGARHMAGRYARNYGTSKVLLVTDPGIIKAGWSGDVAASLDESGIQYAMFSDLSPNPRAEECMAGSRVFLDHGCDALVSVGGGSVIDCAKAIGIVSSNHQHILEFEGVDRIAIPGPPLICIPTTSGSSADVSQFAVINDRACKMKRVIASKMLVPDVSLIDPGTLTTMDDYLTACTCMDALCHAIEAYVSTVHSQITDLLALEAVRLVSVNLPRVIRHPDDLELRASTMSGSLFAGLAFSSAILGAVHSMAHSLGGLLDYPHGECNAILLRHVVGFNYPAAAERYDRVAEAMGLNLAGMDSKSRQKALQAEIYRIQKEASINRTLSSMGVKREDIPGLAKLALDDICMATNPRPATARDLEVLYEEAL